MEDMEGTILLWSPTDFISEIRKQPSSDMSWHFIDMTAGKYKMATSKGKMCLTIFPPTHKKILRYPGNAISYFNSTLTEARKAFP